MLLQDLERQVLAERHVAAVMVAAGAKGDMPTMQAAREVFDGALLAMPTTGGPRTEQDDLREALGV